MILKSKVCPKTKLEGKFIITRVLHGEGTQARIIVMAIDAEPNVVISYKNTGAMVDVWLTDGMPDLVGPKLGVAVYGTGHGE